MRATVLAAALVLGGAPLAWGLDPAPEPYREAALAGNVGVVIVAGDESGAGTTDGDNDQCTGAVDSASNTWSSTTPR